MASFNKVVILGNLTADPVVRYITSGKAVCECSVAINDKYKNAAGNQIERVTFVDVVVWGRTAEVLGEYCHKGSSVLFEGRLQQDSWEDKNTGAKRTKLKVQAELLQFIGGRRDGAGGSSSQSDHAAEPAAVTDGLEFAGDESPF